MTNAELNSTIASLKQIVDEKSALITEYKQSKSVDVETITAVQQDLARLVENETALKSSVDILKNDIESKETAMEMLKAEMVDKDEKFGELSKTLEGLVSQQQECVKEMETAATAVSVEKAELEAQVAWKVEAMEELEAKMKRSSEKLAEKVKKIEALEQNLESTTTLLSEGSATNTQIQKDLSDSIGKVESDLLYKTSKLDTALFEVERLKALNKESIAVKEEFVSLKDTLEKNEQVKLVLEQELSGSRAECGAMALELKSGSDSKELADQNLILKAEIDGLKIHNQELSRRVQSSASDLEELVSKADKARDSTASKLESKIAAIRQLESTVRLILV
jgi:chromosome segregation ATPase